MKSSPARQANITQKRLVALHFLYMVLVAAVLANGLHFWLEKAQILPSPAFQDYLRSVQGLDSAGFDDHFKQLQTAMFQGMHALPKHWLFTKALKDVFVLVFIIWSILSLRGARPAITPGFALPALLALLTGVAFCYSLLQHGTLLAVIGLRPFAYLAAGLLGVCAADRRGLDLLSRYLFFVLVCELVLGLYETVFGLPLFSTARLGNRITGTFLFPASLGIFAVFAFVFAATYSRINRFLLSAVVIPLIYLTGSATAIVLFAAALAIWLVDSAPHAWRPVFRVGSLAAIAIMLAMMPKMVARPDALDSLWGRVEVVSDYWQHLPPSSELFFGKGLGIGANAVNSAIIHSDAVSDPTSVDLFHARADSTPMALINQIGLVGTLVFYLMLLLAAWRDRPALPVYMVVLMAGMTINLVEFFPVNFLLGLMLCRSLMPITEKERRANRLPPP